MKRVLTMLLGVWLGWAVATIAGQIPEGSIGRATCVESDCLDVTTALPTHLLGRFSQCAQPGFILASGELNAADHEVEEGYFAFGLRAGVSLQVVPKTPPWSRLKELRGQEVELVIRVYNKKDP